MIPSMVPPVDEKRGQGRPSRDTQEVGREKLLEKVRAAMRVRPKVDIQRRELAEVAGVTPALVSYYFPDKWELLEAAAYPIITVHIARVREILGSDDRPTAKLRTLVRLYIAFNREHGHLLDYYLASIERGAVGEGLKVLTEAHQEIVHFLRVTIDEEHLRETGPEVLHSIIWSMCQYVAQLPGHRQDALFPSDREADVIDQQAGAICNLLLNGMLLEARSLIAT